MIFELFISLAMLSLLKNAVSDIKMHEIDSRYNWLMYGATFMLLVAAGFEYIVIFLMFIIPTAVIGLILVIKEVITDGDFEAYFWIMPSIAMVKPLAAMNFLSFNILIYVLLWIYLVTDMRKKKLKKAKFYVPAYPAMLVAFIATAII